MDSIYRDAYPDIFATFEDDFEDVQVDISIIRLDDSNNVEEV